jgi:hypothetical protein
MIGLTVSEASQSETIQQIRIADFSLRTDSRRAKLYQHQECANQKMEVSRRQRPLFGETPRRSSRASMPVYQRQVAIPHGAIVGPLSVQSGA